MKAIETELEFSSIYTDLTLKNSPMLPALNRKDFPNLVVVGGTATGKTTVAYQLSKVLGFGFLDVDQWIERSTGRTIQELFTSSGVEGFREIETQALQSLKGIQNHIIVPGAGAVDKVENWDHLRQLGPSIWLATPLAEVVHRLSKDREELAKRPMLAAALDIADRRERELFLMERLKELEARRNEQYKQATYRVTIGFATADTCAQFIKQLLIEGQATENA